MMNGRRMKFFLVLFLFIVGFFSCKNENDSSKKIFRYNELSGISTLDPAFAKNQSLMWAVHQLYNTLVEVDDSLNIKPSIATHWEFSEDKKTIKFYLRNDVFFHDDPVFPNGKGRKLVAEDVAYSLGRIIDPKVASPGAWIFNSCVDSIKPFEAIGDSILQINLIKPYFPIMGILSMQYCSIVPKEAIDHYGNDFRRHPVGSGPFQMVAWEEGQALILKKNPNYFEIDNDGNKLPYLDGVKVNFFDSRATEFLEFRQGKLDFINDIDASFKDEVLTKTGKLKPEWEKTISLNKHPYLNIEYLGILQDEKNPLFKNSPLSNLKIRQALNYAIDKRKMILYLRNSIGTAAEHGFVPLGLGNYNYNAVKGYTFQPEKTRSLLAEAGFPNGVGLPQITLLTIPNYASLASFIANELNGYGFKIQVEVIQKSLLLEQTSKSQAVFFRGSWIADYPDAENYLSVFYGKNPAPPNYTRFKNEKFDRLYEEALSTTDDAKRIQLYTQMDQIIIDEAPVVPLWYDMIIHLVQKNIQGFVPNSQNLLELRRVKKL